MKEKLGWMFCLVLVLGFVSQIILQKGKAFEKERWEYTSLHISKSQYNFSETNQPELNKLGEEGWEISAVNTSADDNYLILKRRKK